MIRYFVDTDVFDTIIHYCEKHTINVYIIHRQETINNYIADYTNITELKYPAMTKVSKMTNIFRRLVDVPMVFRRSLFCGRRAVFQMVREGIKDRIINIILIPFILLIYYCIPFLGKKIFQNTFHDNNYADFINKYNIDGVLLNDPSCVEERIFAQICTEKNIPVVVGTDGWDTFLNYGFVHKYSGAMVWGPQMARNAKETGFSDNQIVFTGIPHKNKIVSNLQNADKIKIKAKYEIKPDEKVILFPGNRWYQTGDMEKNFIDKLLNYIETGTEEKYVILFRNNPGGIPRKEDINYNEIYKDNEKIKFQTPAKTFADGAKGLVEKNLVKEISEVFAISDMLFSICSLFMLEAAIANVPGALYNISREKYNVRRSTKLKHYKDMLSIGIPEIKEYKDISFFITMLDSEANKEYVNKFVSEWDYREDNYCQKLFQLLAM
jgi:hypothetical protein